MSQLFMEEAIQETIDFLSEKEPVDPLELSRVLCQFNNEQENNDTDMGFQRTMVSLNTSSEEEITKDLN